MKWYIKDFFNVYWGIIFQFLNEEEFVKIGKANKITYNFCIHIAKRFIKISIEKNLEKRFFHLKFEKFSLFNNPIQIMSDLRHDFDELLLIGGYDINHCSSKNIFKLNIRDNKIIFKNYTPMIKARVFSSLIFHENQIIVISSDFYTGCGTVEWFDIFSQKWILMNSILPNRLHHTTASIFDNKIFVFGGAIKISYGWIHSDKIYVLEKHSQTWNLFSHLSEARVYASSIFYQDNFYICGGQNRGNEPQKSVEIFNPITRLIRRENMNKARINPHLCIYEDELYAIGGEKSNIENLTIEKRDKITKKWEILATLNEDRYLCSISLIGSKIYIFGGGYNEENFSNRYIWNYYDILNKIWASQFLPIKDRIMKESIYGSSSIVKPMSKPGICEFYSIF